MKGDVSILKVGDEVTNLISNSNIRYTQRVAGITGSNALSSSPFGYISPDRFVWARNGAGNGLDAQGTTAIGLTSLVDSRFEKVMSANRQILVPASENLVGYHKIESCFAQQLAINGKMSFSKLMHIAQETETVTIIFSYADSKDNFTTVTPFNSVVLTKGVNFPDGVWDEVKIENVPVPALAINGVQIEIRIDGDGATVGLLEYDSVGWQCNPGEKVFDWRLMRGNEIEEIKLLKRYFRKSYRIDTAVGTATGQGMIRWSHSNNIAFVDVPLDIPMRAPSPFVTLFSEGTGASGVFRNNSTGTDIAAFVTATSEHQVTFQSAAGVTAGHQLSVQYSIEAEL